MQVKQGRLLRPANCGAWGQEACVSSKSVGGRYGMYQSADFTTTRLLPTDSTDTRLEEACMEAGGRKRRQEACVSSEKVLRQ